VSFRTVLSRRTGSLALVAVLIAGACSSSGDGDDEAGTDATTTSGAPSSTEAPGTTEPGPTGSEPAETTTTAGEATGEPINVGITYVDVDALVASGLEFNLGDHRAAYTALIEDINNKGGIHGRPLVPSFVAVDPSGAEGADAACLQLAEDDESFIMTGFFLNDAVLCPLEQHGIPVAGGDMTPERLDRAGAPWLTPSPDTDRTETVVRTLAERGELDGTVALYAASSNQAELDNVVVPVLDELGIETVETGIMDAPAGDTPAIEASVGLIAERFEAAGADTVLLIANSGANYPTYQVDSNYRPKLLFTDPTAVLAFATSDTTSDTSILEGALAGGDFGPDQAKFDEATMQECVEVLLAAGVATPAPDTTSGERSDQEYQAAFQACPDIYLLRAWLDAAGPDPTVESLEAAIDGLEVAIPGDPEVRTYGPPPDADGDPAAYLYAWDESSQELVLAS